MNKDDRCFLWALSLALWDMQTTAQVKATATAIALQAEMQANPDCKKLKKKYTALFTVPLSNPDRIAKYAIKSGKAQQTPRGPCGEP